MIEIMGTIYYASFQVVRVVVAITVLRQTVSKDTIGHTSEALSPFDQQCDPKSQTRRALFSARVKSSRTITIASISRRFTRPTHTAVLLCRYLPVRVVKGRQHPHRSGLCPRIRIFWTGFTDHPVAGCTESGPADRRRIQL